MNDTIGKSHFGPTASLGASETAGTLHDAVKDVPGKVDAIKATAGDVKDRIVDIKNNAVKTGNATLEKTRAFVAARPLTALGVAFGVGYVALRVTRMFR